jgi:hypothetical protein
LVGINAEEPHDLFFFIASVATAVNADSGELAPFAPAFEGERGDTEEVGNFADGEQVREIFEIQFGLDRRSHMGQV